MTNYLEIESVTDGFQEKVHQNLKFKTGKFIWQIKFNTALDPTTVNNINLYVTSINMAPLSTNISYDAASNIIEIEPLDSYAKNESYILHVTTNVKSRGGKPLKQPIKIQFHI
ncbi:MAG: Ig-like domain-containing protein [Lachnospiraceae bacterium]|nr:Ig-like domain-containing protein [Lachnospiraceae bacterium]